MKSIDADLWIELFSDWWRYVYKWDEPKLDVLQEQILQKVQEFGDVGDYYSALLSFSSHWARESDRERALNTIKRIPDIHLRYGDDCSYIIALNLVKVNELDFAREFVYRGFRNLEREAKGKQWLSCWTRLKYTEKYIQILRTSHKQVLARHVNEVAFYPMKHPVCMEIATRIILHVHDKMKVSENLLYLGENVLFTSKWVVFGDIGLYQQLEQVMEKLRAMLVVKDLRDNRV